MKRADYVATLGFAVLIGLGAFLAARSRLPNRVGHLRNQVAQTATQLTAEPETILASAIDQRHRAGREAIAAMQSDLTRLVALESAYVADSGRPNFDLLPPYSFSVRPGSSLSLQARREGWTATITSAHSPIRCMVSVDISYQSRTSIARPIVCLGQHTPFP